MSMRNFVNGLTCGAAVGFFVAMHLLKKAATKELCEQSLTKDEILHPLAAASFVLLAAGALTAAVAKILNDPFSVKDYAGGVLFGVCGGKLLASVMETKIARPVLCPS